MDAPKCRLCGKRHWGPCADMDNGMANSMDNMAKRPEKAPAPVKNVDNAKQTAVEIIQEKDGMDNNATGKTPVKSTYQYRDATKRREYMRNKMREIRAKERECE